MTDKKSGKPENTKTTDELNLPDSGQNKKLTSRRSFAKSGIAGGAVLMSLLSRPALGSGQNDPRCTGSILASIDAGTSLHDFDPDECRMGCTPGFWCYGQPPDIRAWGQITSLTGFTHMSKFSDIFNCGPGPAFPNGGNTSLQDIICIPNGAGPAFQKQSARHSIAAWLNATIMAPVGPFFPYTATEIVNGYCAAFQIWANAGMPAMGAATIPLSDWHLEMDRVNNLGCPLNNDPNNIFYQ